MFGALARGAPAAGLIAVEPSARPEKASSLAGIPTVLLCGDFLSADPFWISQREAWQRLEAEIRDAGIPVKRLSSGQDLPAGHSHLPMLDRGNDICLDACLDAFAHGMRATDR